MSQTPSFIRPTVPAPRNPRRRPNPAVAAGERLTLGPGLQVRCAKDLTRIHGEPPLRKDNLVKFDYLDGDVDTRPTDAVLVALLKLAALPADHPSVVAHGRRCWRLIQDTDGWKLALELTGGPHGKITVPGRDADGRPVGRRIDPADAHAVRLVAGELLTAAIDATERPDAPVNELALEQLRSALS